MHSAIFPQALDDTCQRLHDGWMLAASQADAIQAPEELEQHGLQWQSATVPGTVAMSVNAASRPNNIDDFDWWYRCQFDASANTEITYLCFDGLATLAQVWLNGELILSADNMFVAQRVDVSAKLAAHNELVICFRSLTAFLKEKKPKPAWKTNLVTHQNLRWVRTTLLGRLSSWEPKLSAVGPWRAVYLQHIVIPELISAQLSTRLDGQAGVVSGRFSWQLPEGAADIKSARLMVGEQMVPLKPESQTAEGVSSFCVESVVPTAPQWWPHTHGKPALVECKLVIDGDRGEHIYDLGRRGFRQVEFCHRDDKLQLQVNGENVFCRGACWSVNDITSLVGAVDDLKRALILARDAGMNMIRVGGTMTYESDEFYSLCDELGIMVWQDFMFACMDYPLEDEAFHRGVLQEAHSQLARISTHPSICVYCGNGDVQLVAAMVGAPRERWSHPFFDQELRDVCQEYSPGTPYFPSTPCGGALPFHLDQGLAHYYGVGAFKRPLADIHQVKIKFSPEAMGFSNIPEPTTMDHIFGGEKAILHDPRWKTVVPRDAGMGWDFEDIRDHYLQQLFNLDPVQLRSRDTGRYIELSRVVPGEMLYRVFSLWRSRENPCSGGLVWFYKDLLPGPGWGLIDSLNNPKATYYALRRAFSPLCVFLEDRGLNGFYITAINETDQHRNIRLELQAFRQGDVLTLEASRELELPPRSNISLSADEMLAYFSDLTYSYQFGPVQHEIVHVRMTDAGSGEFLADDSYFPISYSLSNNKQADVDIELLERSGEQYLRLTSKTFLQYVRLDLKTYNVEDNYFHLLPGRTREVRLISSENSGSERKGVKGYLEAINLLDPIRILIK